MSQSQNSKQAELAQTMSKFQTVAAAKAWWASLSPSQKGATLGLIAGMGMGGYVFFATYKAVGVGTAIWASILYGSASGVCVGGLAGMAFTPKEYSQATKGLGDKL